MHETKRYNDNKEDTSLEMMQAFNKKLDDLQKDLEKVKRNQTGTQRNTRISDLAGTSFIFKSMYIPASLLDVLTPKYARFWLRLCFLLLVLRCLAAYFIGVSSVCGPQDGKSAVWD
jgi:hypothetical protein